MPLRKKVVVIGGGTGTYVTLIGLKKYPLDLTAVVAVTDSGGSSGKLRDELGVLPPGDIRRALLALSNLPLERTNVRQLLEHRFSNGSGLKGHSFGNLLLTALTDITGRLDLAISEAEKIFDVKGRVLPVSLNNTDLCVRLEDGTIIKGESNIDVRRVRPGLKIIDVYLDKPARVLTEVKRVITEADVVVLPPGDLYTSLLPNLLVEGVTAALAKSRAKLVYVCNLMTKFGETDNFKVSDFIKEVRRYLGPAGGKMKTVLVNNRIKKIPLSVLKRYKKERAFPVEIDKEACSSLGVELRIGALAAVGQMYRHDSDKLAKAILS